jgi:hypothetical protein
LGGFWLDAHSGLVEPELIEIAAELIPHLPNLRAIIFEIMPEFVPIVGISALAKQLEQLHALWENRCLPIYYSKKCQSGKALPTNADLTPNLWEVVLGAGATGVIEPELTGEMAAWRRSAQPAIDLYRRLAQEGRGGMLVVAAPCTLKRLMQERTPSGLRCLLAEFWACSSASFTALDEGRAFLRFVADLAPEVTGLAKAIADDEEAITRILGSESPAN